MKKNEKFLLNFLENLHFFCLSILSKWGVAKYTVRIAGNNWGKEAN